MTDPTLIKLKKTISEAYTGAWSSEKEKLMEECLAQLQTALWGSASSEPEMTPFELRKETICQLRKIFQAFSSPEWVLALEEQSDKTITKAAKQMLNAQRIIYRLKAVKLVEIRDDLRESKGSLIQGRKSVQQSLENLQDVSTVLKTVTGYIKICARVVGLELGVAARKEKKNGVASVIRRSKAN